MQQRAKKNNENKMSVKEVEDSNRAYTGVDSIPDREKHN